MLALAAILGRVTQPRAHCRYASRPSEGAGEVTGGHWSPGPLGWPPLEVQEVCERNAAPLGCPLLGPQYRPFPGGPTPARTWSPGSLRSSGPGRSVRVNYHPSLPPAPCPDPSPRPPHPGTLQLSPATAPPPRPRRERPLPRSVPESLFSPAFRSQYGRSQHPRMLLRLH